jgi:hypothetical protein
MIVREQALASNYLHVFEIPEADKANAWNLYIHKFSAMQSSDISTIHVFVDGDVQVEPASLSALADAFAHIPTANAIGALPTTGRDREAWSRRMIVNGTLAGGLYALRGDFVRRIRQRNIRIPKGFLGEDWLVSLMANSDLQPFSFRTAAPPRVAMAPNAGFSFRSLSLRRPNDYRTYLKRLWRYSLRGVQYEMVFCWLMHQPPETLPLDVENLYLISTPPSRLKWVGITSPLRFWAVQKVRMVRFNTINK